MKSISYKAFVPITILCLMLERAAFAQDAAPADRNAVNTAARPGDMMADSPVIFPKEGPMPVKYPPDVKQQGEPVERDYYLFSSPCRSIAQIDKIQAEMPPGTFTLPPSDWKYLPRTRHILAEGGELRLLAVGDSIVNDTMRSGWVAKLQEAYPKASIKATVYVRGAGGCQHYKTNNRVTDYIVSRKPNLVFIGGISQKDVASIHEVIQQLRGGLPEVEILLATGTFGTVDPRDPKALANAPHSGTGAYGQALKALAAEERCAYLDMTAPWAEYIRSSRLHPHLFYRDVVHANEYGEQILAKIMMAFWDPPEPWLSQRLEWFQDQKFGFMMHWAPYSQWGCIESWPLVEEDKFGRPDDLKAWTERGKDMARFTRDYWALPKTFNPVKFDPRKWAATAKEAGMKYVVFTTKHHDGFSLFDTKFSDYRITAPEVPFSANQHSNVVREVFNAFRKEQFGIGAYFSKADWHCPDYWDPAVPARTRNPNYDTLAQPEKWQRFVDFTHGQIQELMTGYGPIDILWLDAGQVRPPQQDIQMDRLVTMARQHQPRLIVVDRTVGGRYENYRTPEQEVPEKPLPYAWETCMTMGDQWSFKPGDNYKTTHRLIQLLVDIVGKGGNFLLNIGPQPDGELPPVAVQRMKEIGAWMKVNGEAIYGTRPIAPYKEGQVVFTQKGKSVHAIYLTPGEGDSLPSTIRFKSLRPKAGSPVRMLGVKAPLKWQTNPVGETVIEIPSAIVSAPPSKHAFVIRFEPEHAGTYESLPRATEFIHPVPAGLITCSILTLELNGVPVWVENLTKPCPPDAPDWFRYNTSNNLAVNIASFTCTNTSTLNLHLDKPVKALTVRPKNLRIAVTGKNRDWSLALPGPCKLYVEAESFPPLLVFADPPEADPMPDPAKTRIFNPGVHYPGLMTLEDNAQVYLAPGAVVYGGFRGKPRNAKVFGRGILDGSELSSSMVRFDGASNVVVEGIMMRCGKAWQNTLQNCDEITYRNVKILSFVPYGDGIDPVCSRNIRIENCFFRCSDDCIAVKAMRGGPKVSGITVQDCIMAGYNFSDGFTIGYEAVTEVIEGIIVKNCDILYARGATKAGQHSAFSIICDGPAVVRNVTFEDIRIEENITRMFELNVTDGNFYSKAPPGRIQNVRLKNIQWEKSYPILINGHNELHLVENVLFEGCTVAGMPLSAFQIQTNSFSRNIIVRP